MAQIRPGGTGSNNNDDQKQQSNQPTKPSPLQKRLQQQRKQRPPQGPRGIILKPSSVQIEGLVLLKIIKHCGEYAQQRQAVEGKLLGLPNESKNAIEVTNSFAVPITQFKESDETNEKGKKRAAKKANEYAQNMINLMSRIREDNLIVGFYRSALDGTYLSLATIDAQYRHQQQSASSICIIYDPTASIKGRLVVRAFRLTDSFMKFYAENTFGPTSVAKHDLASTDIFEELKVKIHNTHLVHAYLYEIAQLPTEQSLMNGSNRLHHSHQSALMTHFKQLNGAIDAYADQTQNFRAYWSKSKRNMDAKEGALAKWKKDNQMRLSRGQKKLPMPDLERQFPAEPEPDRMESVTLTAQMNEYCEEVETSIMQGLVKLWVTQGIQSKRLFVYNTITNEERCEILLHLAQDKNSESNPLPLLSQGANPNIRDQFYHKWTPLHYAVFLNKENFALALLSNSKTNALLLDSDGFSPLYWASKKSTAKIIKALLSKGCDPNERDMHGMTALFAAVASNKPENVQALVSHPSIDVNQPNQFGGSALHHTAYATDNVQIAEILVKAGANLFLFDYENQSPLHVAKRHKKKALFKYFKHKMEKDEPSWKCDLSSNGWDSPTESSNTDNTEAEDEKMATLIQNNTSNDSHFSQQSSSSNEDIVNNKETHSNPVQSKKNLQKRRFVLTKKRKTSSSPQPKTQSSQSWSVQHQHKLSQVQENKLNIALKIEQSNISTEARELLQTQQYYFQFEQEVFYESMKHEYNKLHHQLSHFMSLSEKLIKENTKLKRENIELNMAVTNVRKVGTGHGHRLNLFNHSSAGSNVNISEKKTSKKFRKWFKKEIGNDFIEYYDCFVTSGFDDLRTIRHINHEQELVELGIDKKGHRLHILDKIETLRLQQQACPDEIALPALQQCASSPINRSMFNNDDIEGQSLKTE